MKRIILFFTVCLGLSVCGTTFADDATTIRAATKRTTVTTSNSSGRASTSTTKRTDNTQNSPKNTRTAAKPQQNLVSRTTTKQNVKPRESNTATTTPKATVPRTTTRTATTRAVNSRANESKSTSGSATTRTASSANRIKHVSRATEINTEKIQTIKSLDYSKCKTVYYECMDEFCANKDSNLRRCACSSRIHEFDNIKKQLNNVEDKMLDFNQRLLTVSLAKEDAAAINVATEGELAFSQADVSSSEKLLQKISKNLNTSGDSKINNDLSAISLSLNLDTAWDEVDSTSGIATSAKSGLDLYNAAGPVCVAMAREVCTDDELNIAENGYKLTIQQDCDTVAKSYKTQYNTALEKIYESSALLDMSRLNVYQQNNSDDTLTCKKKILNQLSNTSVCGENLYKCLDMTGQYIDPSTGDAFLSNDLYEITNLLQEPGAGERWSTINQNAKFVNFLNSKKKFLEPAIQQCRDIADTVWQDFLDDALAQIKLAQNAKLTDIKQSCTTLVVECKTDAEKSLSEFDARALSTFNIEADKTVNKMCSEIETACASLMANNEMSTDWASGMTGIAADISYQKILETCTTVGRDCIVQQCNGTTGNFALCKKATDVNRTAILKREVCWNKVLECVQKADNLDTMSVLKPYNDSETDYWSGACTGTACYIAEQIWGNCESNKISTPNSGSTLLSWFAANTGTAKDSDSCNSTGCPTNYTMAPNGICQPIYQGGTSDCGEPKTSNQVITVTADITNYCENGVLDNYGNCCTTNAKSSGICVPNTGWQAARLWNLRCTTPDDYLCQTPGNMALYCITTSTSAQPIVYYTDTAEYQCGIQDDNSITSDSMWVIVDENGNYYKADKDTVNASPKPVMYYNTDCNNNKCTRTYNNPGWTWTGNCATASPQNSLIQYETN